MKIIGATLAIVIATASASSLRGRSQGHLFRNLAEQTCSAPLPKEGSSAEYGCINIDTLGDLAVMTALDQFGVNGEANPWIKEVIRPVVSAVSSAAAEHFEIAEAGYCLGTFDAPDITSGTFKDKPLQCKGYLFRRVRMVSFQCYHPRVHRSPNPLPRRGGLKNIEMCVAFTACGIPRSRLRLQCALTSHL